MLTQFFVGVNLGILKEGHEVGNEVFNTLWLGADGFEEDGINDEVDPKTGKGLCGVEDNIFIVGGELSFLSGIIFRAAGIFGIKGTDRDVVSVVMFISSFPAEFCHVFLGGVSNEGEGLSHGDPANEEMSLTVNISCISGTIGEVDATSEVAVIGAVGRSCCFTEACFAKKGVAAFADGMTDLFFGSVKKGEDFGGLPRASSSIRFHAFEGGKLGGGLFPTLDSLGSLGTSWFLIPIRREFRRFSLLS